MENQIIHDIVDDTDASIIGEQYIPLGNTDFQLVIDNTVETQPNVIINTLNEESNIHFFEALYGAGFFTADIPVVSLSFGKNEQ